jgi:hypothetical protein
MMSSSIYCLRRLTNNCALSACNAKNNYIWGVVMGFAQVDRSRPVSCPELVEDLVPDNHLAKFIVAIVALFDLTKLTSCRAMDLNTYDHHAYMYICCTMQPHHSTIS